MRRSFLPAIFCLILTHGTIFAEKVIWEGMVKSDGTPTSIVKLHLGETYQIKVSGTVNLGKWWRAGVPFIEDACYEFSVQDSNPQKLDTFKNSMNIPVCDDKYHPDHVYESRPFIAAQSGIHFWIHDVDYSDNSGALKVQITQ